MKIRSFVPHNVPAPAIDVVRVTEDMQVSGRVRLPAGDAFGVMRGGVIVAWAAARLPDENGVRHITVETDIAHRRRGYATACLQALVQHVPGKLLYQCQEANEKSAKAALAAGFVEVFQTA